MHLTGVVFLETPFIKAESPNTQPKYMRSKSPRLLQIFTAIITRTENVGKN